MVASTSIYSSAQDTQALKAVWENLTWESCPSHYNFHLHTHCSDGQLSPTEVIDQALEIGLKGLAITDHHSLQGYYQAQRYLQSTNQVTSQRQTRPHLWTGIEVTSDLGGVEVHLLGYGFNPEHPALVPYIQGLSPQGRRALAENVVDALHHAGGLVVLAHPQRYYQPASYLIPLAAEMGVDGVEAYYAYGNPKPWRPTPEKTETVLNLGRSYGLIATCGTDTHGKNIQQRI